MIYPAGRYQRGDILVQPFGEITAELTGTIGVVFGFEVEQ
jgi:hypothetical protein